MLIFYLFQAIGGAPDALRMQRVVSFYEKLPRGAAPEAKAKGLLGRYQAKYFGKKTSVQRMFTQLSSNYP
jgi:F-type H+-transporting ATPase subunit f